MSTTTNKLFFPVDVVSSIINKKYKTNPIFSDRPWFSPGRHYSPKIEFMLNENRNICSKVKHYKSKPKVVQLDAFQQKVYDCLIQGGDGGTVSVPRRCGSSFLLKYAAYRFTLENPQVHVFILVDGILQKISVDELSTSDSSCVCFLDNKTHLMMQNIQFPSRGDDEDEQEYLI